MLHPTYSVHGKHALNMYLSLFYSYCCVVKLSTFSIAMIVILQLFNVDVVNLMSPKTLHRFK